MNTNFETSIQTRLMRNGGSIAQELTPTSEQLRRWIAIYKKKEYPFEESPDGEYTILDFELDRTKIDEYFGDADMLNKKRYYATDDEDLRIILHDLKIDLSKFTYPWKCDYPL